MHKYFLLTILAFTLCACERHDDAKNSTSKEVDNDNTGKNVRDRDSATKTPTDQSESKGDRTITQNIRKAIVADTTLTSNAKNIKIITINGGVTLRGPVASTQEIDIILNKVAGVEGIVKVDNQLEVVKIKH